MNTPAQVFKQQLQRYIDRMTMLKDHLSDNGEPLDDYDKRDLKECLYPQVINTVKYSILEGLSPDEKMFLHEYIEL